MVSEILNASAMLLWMFWEASRQKGNKKSRFSLHQDELIQVDRVNGRRVTSNRNSQSNFILCFKIFFIV